MAARPTADERRLAQLERRDPNPDEEMVRVRVRLCSSDGFVFGRYFLVPEPKTISQVSGVPVQAGICELEMYPSHVEALEAMIAAEAPKADEIAEAMKNLNLHVEEVEKSTGLRGRRDRNAAELLSMLMPDKDGNRLEGKTTRTYRPSWPASFMAACGREFFPILSVELVGVEKNEPKATTNAKR